MQGKLLVILNIYFLVKEVFPNFQHYPIGITWENATKRCGKHGLEHDVNILRSLPANAYGAEFWIGLVVYRIQTPWIEIIGCYSVPTTIKRNNVTTIASCKRICGKDIYIGYNSISKECACLGNVFKVGSRIQITNCIRQIKDTLFIYKELRDGISAIDYPNNENCITLYCDEPNSAGSKIQTDCKSQDTSIATRCENMKNTSGWGHDYLTALKTCFSKNQLLIPPHCSNSSNIGTKLWTTIFRDEQEEILTQNEAGNLSPIRCLTGFIYDQALLNITERDCNSQITHFVCVDSSDDTTFSTPNVSMPPLHQNARSKASKTQNYIGIIVGVSVTTFGLLTGLVILIVCRVRSIGIFKNANQKNKDFTSIVYETKNISNKVENAKPTSNSTYGLDISNAHDTYAQVKKKVNTKSLNSTSDDTYVDSPYGEYDCLNVSGKRKVHPDENTYDSNAGVRDEVDPTYDSSRFNQFKNRESDVYGHSFRDDNSDNDFGYASSQRVNIEESMYDKSQ